MASILGGLNEAQHTAVTSPSDVLQILAPPGSGKTKTLTSRVAYLLQHYHYKPWNIICLTFTIKSSKEMRKRIANLLGNGVESRLILGTFHSVCRRYLVTYGHLIGLQKDFGIADSSDTLNILKRIAKRLGLGLDPRKAQSRISNSKSRGMSQAQIVRGEAKKTMKNVEQQEFSILFQAYDEQLEKSNLLDYDDLLLRCVDLLRQHPACVSNVEVVLIDEFQDTNIVQFDLMRLLAGQNKRVTTVGDPDQSIYGWRSAEIKNLKKMQEQYPDTLVIHLKDNYRSSGAILLAAHEVIEQDESRPSKPLLPTHCPGTVPVLRRLPSSEVEALWIVSEISRAMAMTGNVLSFSDFAILLRSASISRHIESALGKAGMPYRMVGGQRFFDRMEIKILLDYLRVISQPRNNDALSRIINVPTRGVGATTAKALLDEAEIRKTSLWAHVREIMQGHRISSTRISKAATKGLGSLVSIIGTSRIRLNSSETLFSPENLIRYVIKKLDFKSHLEKTYVDDHESRWANVEELIAQASEYSALDGEGSEEDPDHLPQIDGLAQSKGNAAEEALSKFLGNVALATELQREDEDTEDKIQSQVTISTIHAAKGLEWPAVFVPSAYEGCIPHSRAEDTDEERRLLYVAMTRAQALLYISCPIKNSQREETTLSKFLSSRKISQYLCQKGPSINAETANDICRIIGRNVPEARQLVEACSMLQSRDDDLWPLNGEEDLKAVEARWGKWDGASYGYGAKRKRIMEGVMEELDCRHNVTDNANLSRVSSIGVTTTMEKKSTFSYNGFVSATAQLLHNDNEKETETRKRPMSRSIAKASTNQAFNQGVQGSLMSFLGKSADSLAACEKPTTMETFLSSDKRQSSAGQCLVRSTALSTSSTAAYVPIPSHDHEPSRLPLTSIPQNLSTHRLPSISKTTRPLFTTTDDKTAKKPYVFLSSSPPHNDTLLDAAETEKMEHEEMHSSTGSELIDDDQGYRLSDMKPAATMHKTSVSQFQIPAKVPNKTLGVRRSMNGWASRTNQGFSVPKLAGRKLQE